MELSRRLGGAALAVALVLVLVVSSAPMSPESGVRAAGNGFSWPVSYGQPAVPATVGAQGVQGPTVPLATLGAPSVVGAQGKQGPVNESSPSRFVRVSATLTVTLHNGTTGSSVLALRQIVALQNLTYGQWASGKTGTTGVVNLTVPSGWYVLYTNASGGGFISTAQEYFVPPGASSIARYLIPTSASVAAVNNGPISTRGTVWATGLASWGAGPEGHLEIQLQNASSGNAVLATAYSLANGSVEFTGVDASFSYQGNEVGFGVNPEDGVNYGYSNGGWGGFTVTAAHTVSTTQNNPTDGISSTSGTLTGAALPTAGTNGRWNINAPTKVVGGSTYLSASLQGSSTLTISNGALYLNWSQESYSGATPLRLVNSTVIVLSQDANAGAQATLAPSTISGQHTRFFLQSQGPAGANGALLVFASCVWCWLENVWLAQYSFLAGPLTNSTISNSTQALLGSAPSDGQTGAFASVWSWVSVVNSTVAGGGAARDLVIKCSWMNQTDLLPNRFASSFVNASYLGVTSYQAWSQSDSSISLAGKSTWTHDTLAYILPRGLSWTVWYHRASTTSTSWSFGDLNLTYSVADVTRNGLTPIRNVAVLSNHLSLWNDWLDANYSLSTLVRLTQSGNMSSNVATSAIFTINSNWWTWANDTEFDLGGDGYLATNGGNGSYSHDVWPWAWQGNAYAGFSLFGSVPPSGRWERVRLANDTFGAVAFNSSVFYGFEKRLYGPIGLQWLFDTNFARQGSQIGTLSINYTTFHGTPIGPATLFPAGDILNGVDGVTLYAAHDVFANEPSSTGIPAAYHNGSFYRPPYAEDVIAAGGVNYVNDSYFLNLNNLTLPIGGNAGAQTSGSRPVVTLARDRFFYHPSPLQTTVDPAGPTYATQTNVTPTDTWLSSIPVVSTATYQVPIDTNASLAAPTTSAYDLVSNFSRTETNGLPSSPWNTPNVWVWGVAPDANTSNGSLVVGYVNGLQAGPQPRLYWHGYNYTSNVEPMAVELHVNSSSAPVAYARFAGLAAGPYTLSTYYGSNGTLIASRQVNATGFGTVNATFHPATLTDEIFVLVAPPAPVGPGALATSAWPVILIGVGAVGLVLIAVAASGRRRHE